MESIKNFTNAADMLAAWDSGNFEFTVEVAEGHKLSTRFGKVHSLQLDGLMYVGAYAGGSSTPIRYHPVKGEWRSPSGARRLVARWKPDSTLVTSMALQLGTLFKRDEYPAVSTTSTASTRKELEDHGKAPPASSVLPSDEAGIEAMVKRMLGQPKKAPPAAPAPQKPPFHKGLLIQASEKYMGLGFNDKQ